MPRFKVRWVRIEEKTEYVNASSEESARSQIKSMRSRWGDKLEVLACDEVSDLEMMQRIVPKGASGWQLYTTVPKSNLAASSLSRSLRAAFARLRKVPAAELRSELQKEVAAFDEKRYRWSDCGAADTEPREVSYEAFEKFVAHFLKVSCRISWGEVELGDY